MELTISSPCPKTWEELVGDHRVRYCGQCRLQVYNLTVMKPAEIEQLVQSTGGRLCVQLYVRKDHTATLGDCPEGRFIAVVRRVSMLAGALLALMLGVACRSLERPDLSGWPQWVQSVAVWMDPPIFRPRRILGEPMRPIPIPAPSPVFPPGNGS
ncbi:MAG TPA: hypothetical protein VG457_03010 [Planctomycetota bacterium]|jgi:hypothetical protein|nr:hypothetical protein [Planctomycetota bacterium]